MRGSSASGVHWFVRSFVVLAFLVLNIVAADSTALATSGAPANQSSFQTPTAPGSPTLEQPVFPSVFEGDVRDLPQVRGEVELQEVPLGMPSLATGVGQAAMPDPTLQDWSGPLDMPSPLTTFPGLDRINWGSGMPPDTNGDVGPNHFIQTVNTSIGIFDKASGALLAAFTFNTFFDGTGTPCDDKNRGDPIALYDHLADRWLVSDFAWTDDTRVNGPYYECLAVSRTSDPVAGGWYQYGFLADSAWMNDYPKLGVWPDAYYMSANMFDFTPTGVSFMGVGVWAFDRASMLAGGPLNSIRVDVPGYGSLLPSNLRGPLPPAGAPNYFLSASSGLSRLYLWRFHVDWTTPANSTFTGPTVLNTAAYSVLCPATQSCVPQLGVAQQVDAISNRLMMQLQYRHNADGTESLWANHTVDNGSGVAAVRWYELRDPNGTPVIYQQGTYSPDSTYRWMGSIAADRLGNAALGYSASSSTIYPAIRYAGRLVTDTLGSLPQAEVTMFAGTGSQSGSTRWGDYSTMTVDPEDDCTFWYTNEYYLTTGNNWQTGIGSFRYPTCVASKRWVGSASSSWNDANNWSPAGVPTRYNDILIDASPLPANWPSIDGSAEAHNVTIGNGAQLGVAGDYTLSVHGSWSQSGSGAFDAITGTLMLLGATPTLNMGSPSGSNHFYNLQVGDGTRTPALTVGSDLRLEGDLSVYPGASIHLGAATVTIRGDLDVQGGIIPGSSTLQFTGVTTQSLSIVPQTASVTLLSEDFETWPLTGWNIVNNGGNCVWRDSSAEAGIDPNYTGGAGKYADADNNACGLGTTMDTDLQTPIFNFTNTQAPVIEFKSDMFWKATDQWDVDMSLDGGSTWPTNLLHRQGQNYFGPESISLDLSAAAGQNNVRLRFRYRGSNDYWWQVDEVLITGSQPAPQLYSVDVISPTELLLGSDLHIGNNVTVKQGSTLDLSTHSLSVEGSVLNSGAMKGTVADLNAYTRFLHVTDIAGTTDKYLGVDITPSASMGTTVVRVRGNQPACNVNDELIHRCFDITPSSAQSATVRFWYLNSERGGELVASMQAYHWQPPVWSPLTLAATPRGTAGSYEWIEAVNVSSYSGFGLSDGSPTAPTSVDLFGFAEQFGNTRNLFLLLLLLGVVGILSWFSSRKLHLS